jgi:hypothetical protein
VLVANNSSAWAVADVDGHTNEITRFAPLLDQIGDLRDTVITIDAMHCQRDHVTYLAERGADWILTVKANQPTLHAQLVRAGLARGEVGAAFGYALEQLVDERAGIAALVAEDNRMEAGAAWVPGLDPTVRRATWRSDSVVHPNAYEANSLRVRTG